MPKKTKRKDGRYQVKVYIGNDKYKYVYGATQKEANQKADAIKTKLGKGLDVTSTYRFSDIAEKWIEHKKIGISAAQTTVYKSCIKHLEPISYMPIDQIRAFDIQQILDNLCQFNPNTGSPASVQLISSVRSTARQIFNLAIDNQIIDYNPAQSTKIPKSKKEKTERRALTSEEQQAIILTEHRARTAAMIMLFSGVRRGELLALNWSDVDFRNKTLTINKSVEMIDGQPNIKKGAKTATSERIIDLPDILVDYLHKTRQNASCELICPNTSGNLMSKTSWDKMWKNYIKTLQGLYPDMPYFTAHWLRHTFATLLYLSGCDVLTAKEQLGHSNIAVTLDIYTHLDAIYKRKKMSKLNDFLSNGCQMGVSGI